MFLVLQSVSALLDLPKAETIVCATKPSTISSFFAFPSSGPRREDPPGVQSIREFEFKWQSIACCSVRRGWPCAFHSIRGSVIGLLCAFERHGVFLCVPTHRGVASDRQLAFRLRSASTIAVLCLFTWPIEHCRSMALRETPSNFLPHFESSTYRSLPQLPSQQPSCPPAVPLPVSCSSVSIPPTAGPPIPPGAPPSKVAALRDVGESATSFSFRDDVCQLRKQSCVGLQLW